jgi:hypothetical protein
MLARLHVLLPFYFTVPEGAEFAGHAIELADGCVACFLPPGRSDVPLPHDAPKLKIEGHPAFMADVFVVEFRKKEFDRRVTAEVDPSKEVIQEVLSWFFRRLRYVIGAADMELIEFPFVPWRITYSADDGSELPEEKGLTRGRGTLRFNYKHKALTPRIWNDLFGLPVEFAPPQWEALLLDAKTAMPDVGAAIVLTATSLEVFISTVLDRLAARSAISPTLWEWINDRQFHLKEPSPEEQFDVLLKELCGKTLKSIPELWKAFKSIREARNKFVHTGTPLISGKPVTRDEAAGLIGRAREIVDFVKAALPEELRWPKFEYQIPMTVSFAIQREREESETPKAEESAVIPIPPAKFRLSAYAYALSAIAIVAAFALGVFVGKAVV